MRFTLHGSGSLNGIQIDWAVDVDVGPEIRAAMARHDVDAMQAGRLRRGYMARSILYPRDTIALRIAEGHEIFLQVPAASERAATPAPAALATVATTLRDGGGERHQIVVGDGDEGARVDLIIAGAVPALSRAIVQRLIDEGQVTLAGVAVTKSNRRLHRGDVIAVVVAGPPDA